MYGTIAKKDKARSDEIITILLRTALPYGDLARRIYFMLFIIACETNIGTYPDTYHKEGKGLFQIDSIWYKNVMERFLTESNKLDDLQFIQDEFGVNLGDVDFKELDFSPILGSIYVVFGLILMPQRLPDPKDPEAVVKSYKYDYNSAVGKAKIKVEDYKEKFMLVEKVYRDCLPDGLKHLSRDLTGNLDYITDKIKERLLGR